jgi:hypothetical protein
MFCRCATYSSDEQLQPPSAVVMAVHTPSPSRRTSPQATTSSVTRSLLSTTPLPSSTQAVPRSASRVVLPSGVSPPSSPLTSSSPSRAHTSPPTAVSSTLPSPSRSSTSGLAPSSPRLPSVAEAPSRRHSRPVQAGRMERSPPVWSRAR